LKRDFELAMGCRITDRNPPRHVVDFMEGRGELAPVAEALAVPAVINRRVGS
jgi:hypothetical protein